MSSFATMAPYTWLSLRQGSQGSTILAQFSRQHLARTRWQTARFQNEQRRTIVAIPTWNPAVRSLEPEGRVEACAVKVANSSAPAAASMSSYLMKKKAEMKRRLKANWRGGHHQRHLQLQPHPLPELCSRLPTGSLGQFNSLPNEIEDNELEKLLSTVSKNSDTEDVLEAEETLVVNAGPASTLPPTLSTSTSHLPVTGHGQKREFTKDELEMLLAEYAARDATQLSLKGLLDFGVNVTEDTLLQSSSFVHKELPVRLAKRAVELSNLPHDLSSMSAIKEVRNWYISSFEDMIKFPVPDSIDKERKFTNLVKEIYERHAGVLWNIARGIYQLKMVHQNETLSRFSLRATFPGIQTFLDQFLLSRVGIRVMIGQHIALHEHIDGWIGLFCLKTSPFEISQSAARSATKACMQRYNMAPWVNITNLIKTPGSGSFPYIPAHLHHILFELLKNSMKATIEQAVGGDIAAATAFSSTDIRRVPEDAMLPPIEIRVSEDEAKKEMMIEVIDHGGGFKSQADLKNSWSYMYTTASDKDCLELFGELNRSRGRDFDANERGLPLAGLGYGLPISRVFAAYLGGSLRLENYQDGAKATLTIKAVNESFEAI